MKSILDKSFRYVPSGQTDLRRTFSAERKRLKALAESSARDKAEQEAKIITLKKGK